MAGSGVSGTSEEEGSPYAGWLASCLLIAVVIAIGAALWFHYHG
ncbi:MAG TPA: hypothetical protein VGX00_03195 [Thermoplasmata archaeon]|nr:hypothetical protein [Thermoplasmata archaeon]